MSQENGNAVIAFGAWLDLQIERKGWKPADLARASGIYASTISKYRNGVQAPSAAQARMLADALEVPLSDVLDAAGKGRGLRGASAAQRVAVDLIGRIPHDLLPLALIWLEALADERRWSRYRVALAEGQRFGDGPANGPEPDNLTDTGESTVPTREP